jgi:hypothetical protein
MQDGDQLRLRLMRCHECGGLDAVLKEDLQRALTEGTEDTKAVLQQRIDNP